MRRQRADRRIQLLAHDLLGVRQDLGRDQDDPDQRKVR
jgi:hypothetical protein